MPKGDELPRHKRIKRLLYSDPYKKFGTESQAVALLHFMRECRDRNFDEARHNPDRKEQS